MRKTDKPVRRDFPATPDEGQRLIRAFVKIRDPAIRQEITRLVERIAMQRPFSRSINRYN